MNKLEKTKAENVNFLEIADENPFVKLEKGLIGIGYFSVSKKRGARANPLQEKAVRILNLPEHGLNARAEILTHRRYGLPTISDLTKYLAFLKIVNEKHRNGKLITSPIEFTHYELLQKAGIKRNPDRYKEVNEWIIRLHNTQILLYGELETPEVNREIGIHLFEKFIITGTRDENGEEAKQNKIWLSEWAIRNISELPSVPIDFETYHKLKNDTAKLLVAHLQIWLFGSKDRPFFHKNYAEFAQLLGIKEWQRKGKIKEQLQSGFDELTAHEYISNWKIADAENGFKIMLWHGKKFHRDLKRAAFLVKKPPTELDLRLPERDAASAGKKEFSDAQINATHYLESLGMFTELAEKLVEKFAVETLMRRTAWAVEILGNVEKREKVLNKGGFLHKIINSSNAVPDDFVSLEEVRAGEAAAQDDALDKTREFLKEVWLSNRYDDFCLKQAEKKPRFSFTNFKQTFKNKKDVWATVINFAQKELNPQIFNAWFKNPMCAGYDETEKTVFIIASQIVRDWIESYYADLVKRAFAANGLNEYKIKWLVESGQMENVPTTRELYDRILINDYRESAEAVALDDFYATDSEKLEKRFNEEHQAE